MLDPLRTIIFALNEKYDPVPNRLEEEYKKLHTLPPNFLERYTRLLEGPFDKNGRKRTVKELEILIAEIEQLVDLET